MDITKYYLGENEKPLDVIKPDGGFFGIFRTVACVGDSLSSGEFESTDENGNKGYHDYYEYSWGQYMARAAGNTVYNFSRGGMSAKWYLDSFGNEICAWDKSKACQAYIFALGVNDLMGHAQSNGFHRGSGETGIGPIEDNAFSLHVHGHGRHSVDQAERIRTACLSRPRHLGDVGNVRRKLNDKRL